MNGHWVICGTCEGNGAHSRALGAFTMDEFNHSFDPDEQAEYFAGKYDRRCENCDGTGKVFVKDVDATHDPDNWECGCQACRDEYERGLAEDRALARAERRMGC